MNDNIGNGLLTHPIGLLTADEVAYIAGIEYMNKDNYLYTGNTFITLSPFDSNRYGDPSSIYEVSTLSKNYFRLIGIGIATSGGLRPVINLRADVEFTGDGSYDNPYVIKTN